MNVRVKVPPEMATMLRDWGKAHMPSYTPSTSLEAIILRLHSVDEAWRERFEGIGVEIDLEVNRAFGHPDPA